MLLHNLGPYVPLIILCVLMFRLVRRTMRPRVLTTRRLWIAPAILLAFGAFYVYGAVHAGATVSTLDVAIIAGTALVGVALGALRAHSVKLEKHPETGDIQATLTVWGLAVVVIWIAGRYLLRQSGFAGATTPFGVVTDAFMALAVATVFSQAVVLSQRCQALTRGTMPETRAL
jgi:hypothetical protein